ncbi:helix-turn-helix domain-containing protein [Pedobacter caeni]|uniref:AraC-type DNA-binding protein n=1 Tax=Pedobacter caeni TaxID=288992 RepID=A0A1M4T480_9SPHI|nr:helix-turn-helix domain-containing protein [Pedobacter caeni]SHE39270.1 AraC-type DNA-binding protein [Pedobacter caeni]
MQKKTSSIPVRILARELGNGIFVTNISSAVLLMADKEFNQAHRHDCHFFILQEEGVLQMEIDFEKYGLDKPAIFYQSPNQVHKVLTAENVDGYILIINDENLNPEYLKLLQGIKHVRPLVVTEREDLAIIQQAFALCKNLYERKKDKLYHSQMKDSCNILIALFISYYLKQSKSIEKTSRFDIIERAFTALLEQHFLILKRPADYAKKLNITASYLNECIKNVTGFPVSYHIQQRVILEAKRLLYHSDKSVKEIANELGYDDYPYFSRLFTKVAEISALAFRSKNHD